jgi:hypothetical protein
MPLVALALSSNGDIVAGLGTERIDVRRASGELLMSFIGESQTSWSVDLRFESRDRELVLHDRAEPNLRRVWDLERGTHQESSVVPPLPGWRVSSGPISTFVRESDGLELAVGVSGPWVRHPHTPGRIACPTGLYELRGV